MELNELKVHWSKVLFNLESKNRVAWLTFFDARLENLEGRHLKLDFSDPEKFSGAHSYLDARTKFSPLLAQSILETVGLDLEIIW